MNLILPFNDSIIKATAYAGVSPKNDRFDGSIELTMVLDVKEKRFEDSERFDVVKKNYSNNVFVWPKRTPSSHGWQDLYWVIRYNPILNKFIFAKEEV